MRRSRGLGDVYKRQTKTLVNKYFKLIKMVWLNLILIKMVGYNKVIFISN